MSTGDNPAVQSRAVSISVIQHRRHRSAKTWPPYRHLLLTRPYERQGFLNQRAGGSGTMVWIWCSTPGRASATIAFSMSNLVLLPTGEPRNRAGFF